MARKDGYHPIAPRWLRHNLNPLLGEHWVNERYLRGERISLQHPAFLMFHPAGAGEVLVGVAYGLLHDSTHSMPDLFEGSLDRWHIHWPCSGIHGLGSVLANDVVDCRRLGGHPAPSRLGMVHVWLTPNPAGVFAPDNPALPYAAVGLRPPTREDLLSPSRGRRARLLALALGETYGATPRLGSLVEARPNTGFAQKVARHRTAIRAMVPGLRQAESRGDLVGFDRLASAAIAEWRIIGQAYLGGALNEVHRRLLHRWMVSAIDPETDHTGVDH